MAKKVMIIVNGREVEFEKDIITYEELVDLAGFRGNPSVTFDRGPDQNRQGTMYKGKVVLTQDGMVFNLAHTGAA